MTLDIVISPRQTIWIIPGVQFRRPDYAIKTAVDTKKARPGVAPFLGNREYGIQKLVSFADGKLQAGYK